MSIIATHMQVLMQLGLVVLRENKTMILDATEDCVIMKVCALHHISSSFIASLLIELKYHNRDSNHNDS